MRFFFLAFFLAKIALGSTSHYFATMTHKSGAESYAMHRHVKKMSERLQVLDCPITLIERQWEGLESVKSGMEYLESYIAESKKSGPNYYAIHQACLRTLSSYRALDRQGRSKARALGSSEIEELKARINQQRSSEDRELVKVILSALNQETLCYTHRLSAQAAFIISISAGAYAMECFTPLGRRFLLLGPTVGAGAGMGLSLSLPNSINNPLAYSFLLFRRTEQELWHTTNLSTSFSSLLGLSIESRGQDMHQHSHTINRYDLRPSIGAGFYTERRHQIMGKKTLDPLYINLVQTNLFNKMAKNIKITSN